MAEAAVEFLLDQLSAVISEEWSLLGGIREDAQYIMNALSRLKAALRVVDEREEMDPQVKAWVKIVRELAYDTEDVIDEFLFRFGGCHTGGGLHFAVINNIYTSVKNLRARRRLALALQKIKARISENSQYQPILPTTTVHNHNQQLHDGRVGAHFQEDSDLGSLCGGHGGLGKTTLVKKAYDDAQVTKHFQHRVWVTVSETFKIEELLKDVIKKLGNAPNGDSADELIKSVRNILSKQRYIIVLDDVWGFDVWSVIKYAFPGQKFGSRIVITTSNSEIGRDACHETQGDVYELKLFLKVHDILREIILSKALEQNFAVIVTGQNKEWSDDKCRRLIIHRFDDDDILKSTSSKSHIRSLQCYNDAVLVSSSLLKLLSFDYYIPLKVLDLRGTHLNKIPKEVFKLFHLKYLSLRRTQLRNVPKAIQALQNLEILDLKYTWVSKLPIEIGNLHKLRHLIVGSIWGGGFYAPLEIGRLLCLQKLSYVQAKKINGVKVVLEIGNLIQLRNLKVKDLRQEDGKKLCSSMEKLTNLISLRLGTVRQKEILDIQHSLSTVPLCLRTLILSGRLERIPQWLSSLVSLTKLELFSSCVLEDPLLLLQDLPMLACLRLHKSYEGDGLCFKAGKFPKLKFLDISWLRALKWIMVEEGAMPHLEELQLDKCELGNMYLLVFNICLNSTQLNSLI
nr:disease resistance protein RPM1-like [Ipomoea batatas]